VGSRVGQPAIHAERSTGWISSLAGSVISDGCDRLGRYIRLVSEPDLLTGMVEVPVRCAST
jgi:hypothetical protein